jgi:hypothetical protein
MTTRRRFAPSARLAGSPALRGNRGAIAAAAAAALLAIVVGAGGPPPRATSLFDGKTLDGWKKTDLAHPGEVSVTNGAIVLGTGRSMTGITSTRKDLPRTNYELCYEARRLAGGDFFAAATFPVGESYLTLVNGGWGGSVTGLSSLDGADASENETSRFVKYQNNTWYKFRVRVTGDTIRGWIDDKEVVAVNYKDRHLGTRIESRGNQPLGFATWESTGAVRSITVRKLTPAEIEANHKPED